MILVTGATGFLGKNICKKLKKSNLQFVKTSLSLGVDLRNKKETDELFEKVQPRYLLNCASFVGGIQFNYKHFGEIFKNNLEMTINILEASRKYKVKRIVNPISNCVYSAKAKSFREEDFWNGPLHESIMVYAFVRKAFWVGSWAYKKQYNMDIINLIFSSMYGPGDHFEEERSHAMGALIMKFVKAKIKNEPYVSVWGSGKPVREWLYIDDAAEAMIRAINIDAYIDPINIGVNRGISIMDMVKLIKLNVGYKGEIRFDLSKPDGALYRKTDGSRGEKLFKWKPSKNLNEGIRDTVDWYIEHKNNVDNNYQY